jgi:hypothetical protein
LQEAEDIGRKLGVTYEHFSVKDLRAGMNEELEHGTRAGPYNVTSDDAAQSAKIALAHLGEHSDYYERLEKCMAATIGAATNGAATIGAATNGAATNGAATIGAATNGAATIGAATTKSATNGAATNAIIIVCIIVLIFVCFLIARRFAEMRAARENMGHNCIK